MTTERDYDVIVVGAGPGGFATALVAARSGLRVLVLDRKRFPRDKVCGDAITPLGMTILAQLGVLDAVRAVADDHVPSIQITPAKSSAWRSITTPALVVRRRVLDATLLDLVRPLVEVREGHAVDRLLWCDNRVCGVAGKFDLGGRFEATAGVVVGADGASSIVARLGGCRNGGTDDLLVATRAYYQGVAMTEHALEFHFLPDLGGGYLCDLPDRRRRLQRGTGWAGRAVPHRSALAARTVQRCAGVSGVRRAIRRRGAAVRRRRRPDSVRWDHPADLRSRAHTRRRRGRARGRVLGRRHRHRARVGCAGREPCCGGVQGGRLQRRAARRLPARRVARPGR